MSKKKKRKNGNLKGLELPKSNKIVETKQEDEEVIFSFKYLDLLGNNKFSIAGCGENYLEKLLLRLKDLSTIQVDEFLSSRSPSLRAHEIDWKNTTEPNGFTNLNAYLREITAFQFEISANEYGRVHGFLIDRIFYIVWLDPIAICTRKMGGIGLGIFSSL